MTPLFPKLALAAALTATVPTLAHARPCDDDDRRAPVAQPRFLGPPTQYAPPAPYAQADWRAPHDGWRDRDDRWQEGREAWRRQAWMDPQREQLRVEFARLDQQRDLFYARGPRAPWKVARFERWYQAERAELQQRWDALGQPAWAYR